MSHEQSNQPLIVDSDLHETNEDIRRTLPSRSPRWLMPGISIFLIILLAFMLLDSNIGAEEIQDISQTLNQPGSTGQMNTKFASLISLLLILIAPLIVVVWLYNDMVGQEEKTLESWAQVEAAYQRRADLIPALIETVAKYMKHEQATLASVTEAREQPGASIDDESSRLLQAQQRSTELASAQSGRVPTDDAEAQALANAQGEVAVVARRLIAVAESYPQLKASDQFLTLQAQFEGTENRILTARNRFNEAVESFNAAIRKLPGSLIANIGGFQRKAYFRAETGSASAPERKWN